MESSNSTAGPDSRDGDTGGGVPPVASLSRVVDWLTAAFLVLGGLLFGALGAGLYSLADRDRIATWVAEGHLTSTELSDAELIDLTHALFTWGGIGMAATGLFLAVVGVAFLLYRMRVRRTAAGAPDSVTLAIVGGVVTLVMSVVPLSPVLGGIAAGYLGGGDGADGARVGAYAGLVAALPFTLLGLFVLGGLVVGASELGLGGPGVFVALVTGFVALVSVVYLVGLSALGGYLGVKLAEEHRTPAA